MTSLELRLLSSGGIEDRSDQYFLANKFINVLEKKDFELDEKNKNAILTDVGIDKIEKMSVTVRYFKK